MICRKTRQNPKEKDMKCVSTTFILAKNATFLNNIRVSNINKVVKLGNVT